VDLDYISTGTTLSQTFTAPGVLIAEYQMVLIIKYTCTVTNVDGTDPAIGMYIVVLDI
jgi:hypothetical protein